MTRFGTEFKGYQESFILKICADRTSNEFPVPGGFVATFMSMAVPTIKRLYLWCPLTTKGASTAVSCSDSSIVKWTK